MKQTILCLTVAAVAFSTACRKKAGSSDAQQPPPNSAAAKAVSEMDQKLASGDVQAQLQVLSQLLQAWLMTRNGFPGSVEEFVEAKMIAKVPAPPAGKKFAIDRQGIRVVLADQ